MSEEQKQKPDKEFYDSLRRKAKEEEDARDRSKEIPLEKRRGITVFPLQAERGQ